jgi:hypothetical protein
MRIDDLDSCSRYYEASVSANQSEENSVGLEKVSEIATRKFGGKVEVEGGINEKGEKEIRGRVTIDW